MELICINSTYDSKTIEVFAKHGIKFPKVNEIVTLDRIEKLPRINKIGLFVIPYTQQFISGEIMGISGKKEVSFNKERFTTLLGKPLTEEMIKEIKNIDKLIDK